MLFPLIRYEPSLITSRMMQMGKYQIERTTILFADAMQTAQRQSADWNEGGGNMTVIRNCFKVTIHKNTFVQTASNTHQCYEEIRNLQFGSQFHRMPLQSQRNISTGSKTKTKSTQLKEWVQQDSSTSSNVANSAETICQCVYSGRQGWKNYFRCNIRSTSKIESDDIDSILASFEDGSYSIVIEIAGLIPNLTYEWSTQATAHTRCRP